jgi:hypothetical protein
VLHGGDILNHGGGLNHTTGVTVPFSIRSSTGGLHLAKAVVKRTATNAQLGYDYNIKLSTTSNQTVHQLFVLSTASGTLGPTEGVFDQLIGAPTYGELLLQRTTTVLCRFEELDVGETTATNALPSPSTRSRPPLTTRNTPNRVNRVNRVGRETDPPCPLLTTWTPSLAACPTGTTPCNPCPFLSLSTMACISAQR